MSLTKPYDLLCVRPGRELHVEVKGTTTDGSTVILTRNEVTHANLATCLNALFVVSSIRMENGQASGGECAVIDPWAPKQEHLTPINYYYRVPD